jgi:hypothetical protein
MSGLLCYGMKKADSNVRFVDADVHKPDPRYTRMPLEYFVGKVVKVCFQSAKSILESMWVVVTAVDEHCLVGTLDNDPVYVTHLKCGDTVRIWRTEIIMVHLNRTEWMHEARAVRAKGDYFNKWLGKPFGKTFNRQYEKKISPRLALTLWRDYVPTQDD